MLSAKGGVTAGLVVVVSALLLVGVVSRTPLRHVIQVAPAVLLLKSRPALRGWVSCGAAAVFTFWLVIMTLIWLYLLGLARVVTGHFTATEVALTIVIGAASLAGLVATCRVPGLPRWPARVTVFLVTAAIQVGTVWLSVQPSFATR